MEIVSAQELKNKIDKMLHSKKQVILAIDGCSAAGKTSLARELAEIYDANVFHMDDFFLRPEQRTPERLQEVGGNVDYERFLEEVAEPLASGKRVMYCAYDCRTGVLQRPLEMTPQRVNIIEGTYSLHPTFRKWIDIAVFLQIDEELQQERIKRRNPDKYDRFIHEWIPKEQAYFRWLRLSHFENDSHNS